MKLSYQAKNSAGKHVEGVLDAPSEDQAVQLLHDKGLFVISIEETSQSIFQSDVFSFLSKPSKKDIVIFTRQLATLIDADVPILEGLDILSRQTDKKAFAKIITVVRSAVEGGATLSVALREHEKIFGSFYISLIRVGEVSGTMQETLLYLADYLERIASLNSKIKSALFYPTFVLAAMLLVTIIMMTTVVPQLLSILADSGVTELPLTTRILIAVSGFMTSYIVFILLAIFAVVVIVVYYIRTPNGKKSFDLFKISIPRFGRIVKNLYIARMAETLATLIKAGVPILESLDVCAEVIGNEVYRDILLEAKDDIKGGGSLSETLQRHNTVPKLVSAMVMTGEKTGRTEYMLTTLQKFYKTEAETDVQNLSQLIEPVLILLLGVGIGILVAAILMPIYSLVNVV